jgi:small subunit ribosomal protein S8
MSVNDPIADFLTRIRNAGMARHEMVAMPHSKMKAEMARILTEQGYVEGYTERGEGAKKELVVELKYDPDGRRAAILSTSRGILTDHEARRAGIGGEVLCFVY